MYTFNIFCSNQSFLIYTSIYTIPDIKSYLLFNIKAIQIGGLCLLEFTFAVQDTIMNCSFSKITSAHSNVSTFHHTAPLYNFDGTSGRWQAPAAVLPEGPESGRNTRVRGPEGPEDEQSSVFVSALASATICFSRFSQKSRFSWHNSSTLMTVIMHENFNRVSYLRNKHRVKNSRRSSH